MGLSPKQREEIGDAELYRASCVNKLLAKQEMDCSVFFWEGQQVCKISGSKSLPPPHMPCKPIYVLETVSV